MISKYGWIQWLIVYIYISPQVEWTIFTDLRLYQIHDSKGHKNSEILNKYMLQKVSVIFSVLIYISGRKIKSTSYYLQKWLLPSHWAPCLSIWKIKIHKTWLDRMFKMEKQLNKFLNGKRQRRLWNKVTNHWIVERIDSSKQLVTLKLTISPYFKNSVCTSS
jgi:hypothetical protein